MLKRYSTWAGPSKGKIQHERVRISLRASAGSAVEQLGLTTVANVSPGCR